MNTYRGIVSVKTLMIVWLANLLTLGLVRFFQIRTQASSSALMESLIVFVVLNNFLFLITLKFEPHYALTFLTASFNIQLLTISYFVIMQIISQV